MSEILVQSGVNEFHLYIFPSPALFILLLASGLNSRISNAMIESELIENKDLLENLLFSVKIMRLSKDSITIDQQHIPTEDSIKVYPFSAIHRHI